MLQVNAGNENWVWHLKTLNRKKKFDDIFNDKYYFATESMTRRTDNTFFEVEFGDFEEILAVFKWTFMNLK
jgi:hypothetical protein